MGLEPESESGEMVTREAVDTGAGQAEEGGGSMLEAFWSLGSTERSERLDATDKLLRIPSVVEHGSDDHAYAVKRLVRGLCSSNRMSRQGFVVALTQLLRKLSAKATEESLLDEILRSTEIGAKMRGEEQRNRFLGRLLSFMAVLRAGKCRSEKMAKLIVNESLAISMKKAWVEELALEVVCDALKAIKNDEQVLAAVLDSAELELGPDLQSLSPARLGLLCTISKDCMRFKAVAAVVRAKVPVVLPTPDVLDRDSLNIDKVLWEDCANALRSSSSTFPRVHSAWPKLLDLVAEKTKSDLDAFRNFWQAVVLEGLFEGESKERQYCAVQLLLYMLRRDARSGALDEKRLDVLLEARLVRLLVECCKNKKRHLHKHALQAMQEIVRLVDEENLAIPLRVSITGRFKKAKFDSEKLLEQIMAAPAAGELQRWCANYKKLRKAGNDTTWVLRSMHKSAKGSPETTREVASFLVGDVLLDPASSSATGGGDVAVEILRQQLTEMAAVESSKQKVFQAGEFAAFLCSELDDKGLIASMPDAKAAVYKALGATAERVGAKLGEEVAEDRRDLLLGLKLLGNHIRVQLALEQCSKPGNAEQVDVGVMSSEMNWAELGGDVIECSKRLLKEKKNVKSKKKRKSKRRAGEEENEEGEDDNGPDEIVVLTDVLVTLLSQGTVLFRRVASMAFRLLSSAVSPAALEVIFDVLQDEVAFEIQDEKDDNDDGDDENALEEDDQEQDEEEIKLDVQGLSQQLFADATKADDEKADGDEGSDSDSDQDDGDEDDGSGKNDGEAVEDALGAFVKAKLDARKAKEKKKRLRKQLVRESWSLKCRVVDLLEVFVATQGKTSPLVSMLALPIVRMARMALTRSRIANHVSMKEQKNFYGRLVKLVGSLNKLNAAQFEEQGSTVLQVRRGDEVRKKRVDQLMAEDLKELTTLSGPLVSEAAQFLFCALANTTLEDEAGLEKVAALARPMLQRAVSAKSKKAFVKASWVASILKLRLPALRLALYKQLQATDGQQANASNTLLLCWPFWEQKKQATVDPGAVQHLCQVVAWVLAEPESILKRRPDFDVLMKAVVLLLRLTPKDDRDSLAPVQSGLENLVQRPNLKHSLKVRAKQTLKLVAPDSPALASAASSAKKRKPVAEPDQDGDADREDVDSDHEMPDAAASDGKKRSNKKEHKKKKAKKKAKKQKR